MTLLRSGSATDTGLVRSVNQDLAVESPNLYAVADGMGGHAGGEVAAQMAVDTLGVVFGRQPTAVGLSEAVGFWIAQFLGAIAGALVLWGVFTGSPLYSRKTTGLGTNGYGRESMIHLNVGGAFGAEVILTMLFVFVILTVTNRIDAPGFAGLVIGLTLTVVHLIGIPLTGTSVNPARSLGPALVVEGEAIKQVWLFIVAPLIGGILAALLYRFFVAGEAPTAEPEASIAPEVSAT